MPQDFSTPEKCKKILQNAGRTFVENSSHAELKLLAATTVKRQRTEKRPEEEVLDSEKVSHLVALRPAMNRNSLTFVSLCR